SHRKTNALRQHWGCQLCEGCRYRRNPVMRGGQGSLCDERQADKSRQGRSPHLIASTVSVCGDLFRPGVNPSSQRKSAVSKFHCVGDHHKLLNFSRLADWKLANKWTY